MSHPTYSDPTLFPSHDRPVPVADVRVLAAALRATLVLPAGTDRRDALKRVAEVRGVLTALADDGATVEAAVTVLGQFTAEETAAQDHVEADLNMILTVPLADVLAFAEALRAALTLPAGADDWALSGRMAEVRGALAAVAFDGCTPAAASRVLGRLARGEAGR